MKPDFSNFDLNNCAASTLVDEPEYYLPISKERGRGPEASQRFASEPSNPHQFVTSILEPLILSDRWLCLVLCELGHSVRVGDEKDEGPSCFTLFGMNAVF